MKKLTKQQRKDLAREKYEKVEKPAFEKYRKEYDEINNEPEEIPEIIEQNGIKYKRIEE